MNEKRVFVLATRNAGKVRELEALLSGLGFRILGLDRFPDIGEIAETGESFEENALIKARAVAQSTGLVAVADDSGLEVDALGGAPGVRSARYSHEPGRPATDASNCEKLLRALAGVEREQRTGRFVCVAAAAAPNGETVLARGEWPGAIALARGGERGFGYDPLFIAPEYGLRAAELTPEQKNRLSHRARAFAALARQWPEFWARAWK